jgi:transposase-like protein
MMEKEEGGRMLVNPRIERGMAILSQAYQIERMDEQTYIVKSQSKKDGKYVVVKYHGEWKCTCPDFKIHHVECKHIHAVKMKSAMEDSLEFIDAYKEQIEKPFCAFCGSYNLDLDGVRYNKTGEKQRYRCRDCGKRFVVNEGFSKMRYSVEMVTQALDLYFKGLSLRKVQDHFEQFQSIKIHHTTILKWIQKYTWVIDAYVNTVKPELSEMWHVDEMMIKTGGKWSWLWHAMDKDTRFMVANAISKTREIEDAQRLFQKAKEVTNGEIPNQVVTDGLQAYQRAFKREILTNTKPRPKHIRCAGFVAKTNNNKVERLNETVREREKVMRGMQTDETAKTLMSGFRDYYNFIRPHTGIGIDGKTPAEAAGADLELGRKRIRNLIKQSTTRQFTTYAGTG